MIDRLELTNIGVFPALDLPLDRLTMLVGPNGAGKSTVLRAIELVGRWHCGGFEPKEKREIAWSPRQWEPWSEEVWIYAQDSFESLRVPRLGFDGWSVQANAGVARFRVSKAHNSRPEVIADDPEKGQHDLICEGPLVDEWDKYEEAFQTTGQSGGLGPNDPYWSQHLRYTPPTDAPLGRPLRLQLEHAAMAAPSLPQGERSALASNGAGLPSVLAAMLGADRDAVERIEADLARIVPQVRRLRVLPARTKRLSRKPFPVGDQAVQVPVEEDAIGHRLELELRGTGRVPAELISEGTLYALGLLTAIHGPDQPTLLLIDDLDRGLHLSAQVQLVRVLGELLEQRQDLQIVATTHSPFQLEGLPASQVRVFGLREDGTATARRLSDHPEFARWSRALRTDELWANLGEDWVTE